MRYALLVALTAALLGGCVQDDRQSSVADTTLVELLVELHLANGRIEVTDQPLSIERDSIFAAYGVDSASYADAMAYHARNPDEYSRLYGQVLDRLSAERQPLGGPSINDVPPEESLRRPAGLDAPRN